MSGISLPFQVFLYLRYGSSYLRLNSVDEGSGLLNEDCVQFTGEGNSQGALWTTGDIGRRTLRSRLLSFYFSH